MRRKLTTLLLTIVLLAGAGSGLLAAIKHEPSFYDRCRIEPSPERKERSKEFFKQLMRIANRFVDGQGKWSFTLHEEDVNSYLEEDFVRLGDADALRRVGIHDPRLHFEDDRIRVAFRYGSGFWSTVLSYDLRIWLAPKEVNVIVIEILNRQVGGLPLASQTMLNELKELCRNKNLDVTWYRQDNNPVAVFRLPSNRARHFAQLLSLDVTPGRMTLGGQCNEPSPPGSPAE